MRVKFADLSGALKTAIVFVWIAAGIGGLAFLAGFMRGILGLAN